MANVSDVVMSEGGGARSRVVVTTIGTARPAAAAAVSKGLGLPPEQVVACLYKAPSVLVDSVEPALADKLVGLLSGIGLGVRVESDTAPVPEPEPSLDVALYVRDAAAVVEVAGALSAFLGTPPEQALELVVTPPGVVLGGVSPATVDALQAQLPPESVDVVASCSETALYDLFAADAPAVVLDGLRRDLAARGIDVLEVGGLLASGLDYETGTALWRRHQASGAIRLLNQAFERFDLVLTGSGDAAARAEQLEALTRLAGVPAELAADVLANLPITLEEGIPHDVLPERLGEYAEAGLQVSARMTTFQHVGVRVLDCEDPHATARALSDFGLLEAEVPLPALPFRPNGVLPELQARMLHAALAGLGTRIEFVEASA